MVYIINQDGKPLMPTVRGNRIRWLLKRGKAKVIRKQPFTIQLLYQTPDEVQPVILGIDPGRTNIGVTAVNEDSVSLFSVNVETRNKEVPKLMKQRKAFRQKHRQTKRRAKKRRRARSNNTVLKGGILERHLPSYGDEKTVTCHDIKNKQARFSNRKRPDNWLTPTANHLLQTHLNLVRKVSQFLPVSSISIEVNKFAFMRLDDPSVTGKDFQNGPLKGFFNNIKQAVYTLQDGKCLLCGEPITQYHHVTARCHNGSETIKNRVGLCDNCHSLVHTNEAVRQQLLAKNQGLSKQYDALGVLNQIVPFLLKKLSEHYDVSLTTGYETARFREKYGLSKDHYMDAYVIACSKFVFPVISIPVTVFHIKQFRRHDRQACQQEMLNRKYLLDNKTVAVNRHKACEQTEPSLEEYVQQGGKTDNLTVKQGKPVMKDQNRFLPGCQVITGNKIQTILKKAQGYYYFDNNSRTWSTKTDVTLQNAGLVVVSNS